MLCPYLLTILRYLTKFCRFILLINLFFCLIIFIQHGIEEKVGSLKYEKITNDPIMISYARFFDESSSCNTTETLTLEQKQYFDKIARFLTGLGQETIPSYSEDQFNGRGIVLTIGPTQIFQCKVNLKMIEYVETRLPVQIWYSSSELSNNTVNKLLRYASKLRISACSFTTAECQTINKIWNLNPTYVFPPSNKGEVTTKHFLSKSAAIISATFAEVLFLDTDSYLVRDPEYLFQSDPMYHQFGALFFPNVLISKRSLFIWKLLNMTCGHDEIKFDSGALLVNKRQVWNALHLTKLVNDQYELFCQLSSGGYKDIFRLAFRFLNVKYYRVGIPCSTGHYNGTHFCGFTICQTDSLGRYIFINHLNLMKYMNAGYSSYHLGYTRIGLGDPYNPSFYMQYCPSRNANSCFYIGTESNKSKSINKCINKAINPGEIDNHTYGSDEPLRLKYFENGGILMSKTNNLMCDFLGSLFHYQRQVYSKNEHHLF